MKEELLLDLSDCNHPPIFLKINGQEFFPTKKKKKKQRGRELPVTRGLLIAVINSQHPAGEKTQRSAGSGGEWEREAMGSAGELSFQLGLIMPSGSVKSRGWGNVSLRASRLVPGLE